MLTHAQIPRDGYLVPLIGIPKLQVEGWPPLNRLQIRKAVRDLVGDDPKPMFWGYYADYDWVAFCQLFGKMIDLPKGWPMYCRDIKQLCDMLGKPEARPRSLRLRQLLRLPPGGPQPEINESRS